jgi:prepilin-type N-terminal cleavage/methylation domain-containing protein
MCIKLAQPSPCSRGPGGIDNRRAKAGFTLVETIVAVGVFSVSALALASIFLFSIWSFAAIANYSTLDQANRTAMDLLTREIRQARAVVDVSTNSISVLDGEGVSVTYFFNPQNKQFVRNASDGTHKLLLEDCNLLTFKLYQRNPINGTYDIYPAATNNWQATVKVVQLSWKTSRSLLHGRVNSENIQTARVVIRKRPF